MNAKEVTATIEEIEGGEFDSKIDDVAKAARRRARTLKKEAAKAALEQLGLNVRVKFNETARPRYLREEEGVVIGRKGRRAIVDLAVGGLKKFENGEVAAIATQLDVIDDSTKAPFPEKAKKVEPEEPKLEETTRAKLNELASDLGVEDAEKLSNKAAVIEAIEAKQAEKAERKAERKAAREAKAAEESGDEQSGDEEVVEQTS